MMYSWENSDYSDELKYVVNIFFFMVSVSVVFIMVSDYVFFYYW